MKFIGLLLGTLLLVSADISECLSSYQNLVTNHKVKLAQMIYYSGSDINDFGDFYSCDKLSGTRFVVIIARLELLNIGLGICGPKECQAKDYESKAESLISFLQSNYPITKDFFKEKAITVKDTKQYNNRNLSGTALLSLIILLTVIFCVILGSLIDYSNKKKSEPAQLRGWKALIACFSIQTNFQKLITFPQTSDNLQVFNGIRVLSMVIICVGHSYTYSFNSPSVNPTRITEILKEFWMRLVISPLYVVDFFFIISGFLVAFLTIPEIRKRGGKMNWVMFMVHRFIRICPVYFFSLMIFVSLMKYMGESALWPMFWEKYEEPCKYWWANVLFISNFVPTDEYSCMGWTWYISCDMQFYVITPIFLMMYMKNRKAGLGLLGFLTIASIASMFGQAYHEEYNPGIIHGVMIKNQFLNFYQKPYNRIGAYLIGLTIGLVYREYVDSKQVVPSNKNEVEMVGKQNEVGLISNNRVSKKDKLLFIILWAKVKFYRWIAYALGVFLMLLIIFVPYNFESHNEDYWSRGSKSVYLSVEHLIFSIGFALCMIPLIEGYGSKIKDILSSKYFAVAAKISFTFYLIHPMVILFLGFNRPESHYVSHFNYWYSIPSTILFTTVLSTLLTLSLESPIMSLERILLRK